MNAPTDTDRLAELLAAHGADAARWPEAERNWMQSVLARHPESRSMLDDAAALDLELAHMADVAPAPGLRRSVLLAVTAEPHLPARGLLTRLHELWHELGGTRLAAPALALALAVGLGVGWTLDTTVEDFSDMQLSELAQLDDSDIEVLP